LYYYLGCIAFVLVACLAPTEGKPERQWGCRRGRDGMAICLIKPENNKIHHIILLSHCKQMKSIIKQFIQLCDRHIKTE